MRAHILTIAVAVTLAAPVGAEPAKSPAPKPDARVEQPVVLIAAAAEVPQLQQPLQSPDAAAPGKPARHARVSTCRCGDQNPSE